MKPACCAQQSPAVSRGRPEISTSHGLQEWSKQGPRVHRHTSLWPSQLPCELCRACHPQRPQVCPHENRKTHGRWPQSPRLLYLRGRGGFRAAEILKKQATPALWGAATTCHTADGSQDSIVWPLSSWKSSVDAYRQPWPVHVSQAGMPDTRTGVTQRANQQNQVHTATFQAP